MQYPNPGPPPFKKKKKDRWLDAERKSLQAVSKDCLLDW